MEDLDTFTVIKINHITAIENTLDSYFKKKQKDCILYSQDGAEIKIHKEVFGQTQFMRNILRSAKEDCCSTVEIICPCSKEILEHLVNFLYDGEIHCSDESESEKILQNLCDIFGFPKNLEKRCKRVRNTNDSDINQDFKIKDYNKAIILPVFENNEKSGHHVEESDLEVNRHVKIQITEYSANEKRKGWIPYDCNICKKQFSKSHFVQHMLSEHHHEKKFIQNAESDHEKNEKENANGCKICGKTFPTKYFVDKHVLSDHHGKKVKILKCHICQKGFITKKSLKKHKILVHGEENVLRKKCQIGKHKCNQCKESFEYKWVLRNHVFDVHRKNVLDFEGM